MRFEYLDRIGAALISMTEKNAEMSRKLASLTQPMIEVSKRIDEICKPINIDRIAEVLQGFSVYSQALRANKILIEHQFVFTDTLYGGISEEILDSVSPEEWIECYYFEDKEQQFQRLLNRCKANLQTESKKRLMVECEQAYRIQSYHLACVGLFSLVDGLLSELTENSLTSVALRLKTLHDHMLANKPIREYDVRFFFIFDAMCYFVEENDERIIKCRSLFENSKFENPEPDFLNRHWVIHGRTEREFSRLDVLRILQWIDGLFYLVNPPNK